MGSMLHFTAEEKFFFHICISSWLMIQKLIIIPGLLTFAETLASETIPVHLMIYISKTHMQNMSYTQ